MKSLETVQKTFRIFRTLSKVLAILSFVGVGLLGLAMLCVGIWQIGGIGIGVEEGKLLSLMAVEYPGKMIGELLTDLVLTLADAVLFLYAFRYFSKEQADGTPFTETGADEIKKLGIRVIVLPLVAGIVAAVLCAVFQLPFDSDWSQYNSIFMGIVLILASLIFRYGADLQQKASETVG